MPTILTIQGVPAELPFEDSDFTVKPIRVLWSGNMNVPGCPIYHGWKFKVGRHTTKLEREQLKNGGWHFSGGWWGRRNDNPLLTWYHGGVIVQTCF